MNAGPVPSYSLDEVRRSTTIANFLDRILMTPSLLLTLVLVNHTRVSPNAISLAGLAFGLLGSALFFTEHWWLSAATYAFFFVLDCTDGAAARLTGRVSDRGATLDLVSDRAVLLVAVLTRMAWHLGHNQRLEAWLCSAYLASHYLTDVQWILRLKRARVLPPWAFVPVTPDRRSTGWRSLVSPLSRFERQIRPSTWACNAIFVVGGSLLAARPVVFYLATLLALHWWTASDAVRGWLKRVGRAAKANLVEPVAGSTP